ncbi:MAG TPA: acetyl ornithine aminotransferase family protein [Chloroflexi bacterium]|nr:acetyl ornithine aminotransferase family protein [Chloroflexota bacterium]
MVWYPGPQAQAYVERDQRVVSPSYTRPYPFVMARGRGTEVWDVDGRRYLDFTSGVAVTSTGHCHPQVVAAIKMQAERFLHMSGTDFYYPVQIELAEYLSRIAPMSGPVSVFFANSGAEAVEAAVKLAQFASRRPYFIAFFGGFHGRTLGALAFTASKTVHREGFGPFAPPVIHVPYPDPYRPLLSGSARAEGAAVIRYLEEVVFTHKAPPTEVAGILIEPIQGEGGYIVPPAGFLRALRELCDRHGILLIVDEVQTGVGRTGYWFAVQHEEVEPDIVAVAKGIASGMPLGVMLARRDLMQWPKGAHASTFGGNPVSCAAALATLDLIEHGMMENARLQGELIQQRLNAMIPSHPSIGLVRGRGLMIGVELVRDRESKRRAPELRACLLDEAFRRGLLLLPAGRSAVRLVPPLNVSTDHVEEALALFDEALSCAEAKL